MKTLATLVLAVALIVSAGALADATPAVPQLLNYQGKLLQASGAPVADGPYQIAFSLWKSPTSKDPADLLWSETHASVQTKAGLFAVLLGGVTPLPAGIFSGSDVYLGLTVGSDKEMTPRQQIASAPFAFRAATAATADTVPDGAITAAKLADGAATTAKIGNAAVTAATIAGGSVGSDKIASESWRTWQPTYSASAPMTFTSVTTYTAKYIKLGKSVIFILYFQGTTGGSPSSQILATLPETPSAMFGGGCGVSDTGGHGPGAFNAISGNLIQIGIKLPDARNFTLGSGRGAFVSGVYEAQ